MYIEAETVLESEAVNVIMIVIDKLLKKKVIQSKINYIFTILVVFMFTLSCNSFQRFATHIVVVWDFFLLAYML